MTIEVSEAGGRVSVRVVGDLDLACAGELYERFVELSKRTGVEEVRVELGEMERLHSAGIATLALGAELFEASGRGFRAVGVSARHAESLRMMPAHLGREARPERVGFFEQVGRSTTRGFERFLVLNELAFDAVKTGGAVVMGRRRMPRGALAEQAVLMGVDAFGIVMLLSFLLGLILAFQSAYQLQAFGANIYVANLVGVSMVREFGPLITGIMLAGRSGSAIAAELGTMSVQEEVDALRTMGLEPMSYLVLPRVLALIVVQPMLTLMSDFVGMFGGLAIATTLLDLSPETYMEQTVKAVTMMDFLNGLSKSVVFATVIGFVGCDAGLNIEGGASGVGRATTRAVVTSIFLIIFSDSLYTISTTAGVLL